jgi:hypothetical protein
MPPTSDLEPGDPFHPSALETLETPVAGAVLNLVIHRSFGDSLDGTDDYRVLIAAARGRSMTASLAATET